MYGEGPRELRGPPDVGAAECIGVSGTQNEVYQRRKIQTVGGLGKGLGSLAHASPPQLGASLAGPFIAE